MKFGVLVRHMKKIALFLMTLMSAQFVLGQDTLAVDSVQSVVKSDSAGFPELTKLAEDHASRGYMNKARFYYLAAAKADSTSILPYKRLSELEKGSPTGRRLTYLELAHKMDPVDADIASELAALYLENKDFKRAAAVLAPALNADAENLRLKRLMMPVDLENRKYREVIKTGQVLLSEGDSTVMVLDHLGKAYYLTLDYRNAVKHFLMIPETMSSDKEALYYDLARSYRGIRDYKSAITYLEKAINLGVSPRAASYYGLLGDSYEQIQQNEPATKAYKRGLDFENDGSLLYNIALLYEMKMGDKKNAIDYYERYLKTIDEKKKVKQANFIKNKIAELKR